MALKVRALGALLLLFYMGLVQADYLTEIQVYDDSINKPGEWGLEMHLNATPSGVSTADYRGGIPNVHGFRTTAEVSYAFTPTLEGGIYLPFFKEPTGGVNWAGPAVRLKWIPHAAPEEGGFFWGFNVEYDVSNEYWLKDRYQMVYFPILGYRNSDWLFAANLTMETRMPKGYKLGDADFVPGFKLTHRVTEGVASGFELYSDYASPNHWASRTNQSHQLFWVVDVDHEPFVFNFGIGRGINDPTNAWTVKAIFEIPLH
jgi:hypothetical protein